MTKSSINLKAKWSASMWLIAVGLAIIMAFITIGTPFFFVYFLMAALALIPTNKKVDEIWANTKKVKRYNLGFEYTRGTR